MFFLCLKCVLGCVCVCACCIYICFWRVGFGDIVCICSSFMVMRVFFIDIRESVVRVIGVL